MFKEQDPSQFGISPEMISNAMDASFEALLDENFSEKGGMEGAVTKGIITSISDDFATVDVGMKSEGRIALREFGDVSDIKIGTEVDVYIENADDVHGTIRLSREKARREEAMSALETAHSANETVKGVIFGRVKGGFSVEVGGVLAFLPGSQVDARPIKDVTPLMNIELDFQIVKIDRKKSNVIVSRRAIMDEASRGDREELLKDMHEGKQVDGVVKNITDYGAFIDLGGIDGLLHITDIAWHRISHPSEVLNLGETIKVQVIRFNQETGRVSLGLKQLQNDPWQEVANNFPIGAKVKGQVTNITEYGAFVELGSGVEGLIHVSEMSWTRKNVHPGKILATSQEVEVMVLEIDGDKRRISLGYKQCQPNPWDAYASKNDVGSIVEGAVRSITDFGLFIGLNEEIDGLVHMSDISWDNAGEEALASFKKGDHVKAKILSVDADKERISLGIKQLEREENNTSSASTSVRKGGRVTGKITEITGDAVTVDLGEDIPGLIKRADLSLEKDKQDTALSNVGDDVTAQVARVSKKDGYIYLSIKALEIAEEKEAVAQYTSTNDGGATLGDALASALKSSEK